VERPRRFKGKRNGWCGRLQGSAEALLVLDGLKQRLEIAFAKTLGTPALDNLKKYRGAVHNRLGEQLKQITVLVAVNQDA
jgi:hypothetical protein